ncbi:uncharacterized protein LOC133699424 [Populus nigra]|uniref:uncharacterized protein LOC133699424 n=1 Tax=Populus nigra TaxID=3691 RepID=UPI002B279B14|nr:uncharacterized protein LOC133699424 [Populus nigra]
MIVLLDELVRLFTSVEGSGNVTTGVRNGGLELVCSICSYILIVSEKVLVSALKTLALLIHDVQNTEMFRSSDGPKMVVGILMDGSESLEVLNIGFAIVAATTTGHPFLSACELACVLGKVGFIRGNAGNATLEASLLRTKSMTAGDSEMVQGSISSVLVDSLESNENGDALSPEDVAWVDSCLVKDPEISDGDWSSLKDVLLEFLSLQPESHDSSEPGNDDLPRGTDILMHPPNEAENLQSRVVTDDEVSTIDKEIQTRSNGFPINEEIDVSSSQLFQGDLSETSLEHAFSPNYKEDDDPKMCLPVDEEDELIKQLNKALAENPVQSTPSSSDDSGARKDLKEESLDTLIHGIADLSLDQHS